MNHDEQPLTSRAPGPTTLKPRRRWRRVVLTSAVVAVLAVGGSTAWALDRFVIPHVAIADVSAYEAEQAAGSSASGPSDTSTSGSTSGSAGSQGADASAVVTATSLSSSSSDITISTVTTGSGDDTVTYYVADVTLTDATTLRSAFAQDSFGQNITETTSDIAADNDAIFAINGDYYGFRDTGIVIRNGVVYRDEGAREGLAFYRDGSVAVYDETETTADDLVAAGVWNTLSFGPAIVEGGETAEGIEDAEVDTNVGNHSIQGEQPRTAIGVVDDNHLVFVVVDGRSPGYSAGVTLPGLAEIMEGLGATTAYNLDGGGSSTMVFDGELVNDPLGTGEERGTSDILYIQSPVTS